MGRNGCLEVVRGRASHTWPTTAGIVFESITDEYTETGYNYNVGGKQYRSWKVRFGSIGTPWSDAEIAERYPVGTTVTVLYMRSDPSVAVLEPGHGAGSYLSLAVGPLFAALGGVLAFVFVRKALAGSAGP